MSTKIQGLAKLRTQLSKLPTETKNAIREAIAKSAREICDMAESLVPVGETKKLIGSIDWTWGEAPKGSMILATAKTNDLTATVYAGDSEAFYARWVEFGTQKMSAQPFFFVSYRALRKPARRRINAAVRKAARQAR